MDIFRLDYSGIDDDAGDQQLISALGLPGEAFRRIVRQQDFGFFSSAPAGSHGIGLAMMGRRDRVVALALESAAHRPRGLPQGATALYNADGTVWKLLPNKADLDQGGKPAVMHNMPRYRVKAGEFIHIDVEPGGGVYLGNGPPWHPVVTTAGPSQHVFAGIGPPASGLPTDI
jgi:phage gp45-like